MAKKSPFIQAVDQIVEEKGLDKETVVSTIEQAVAAAYRKDYGHARQLIRAKLDEETGQFKTYQVFEVVKGEDEENPIENSEVQKTAEEIKESFKQAGEKLTKKIKIGDEVELALPYHDEFGRIAAQTAKQVIIQRLREAEREMMYQEFKDKEGTIMPASISQIEGNAVVVNLGKTNALMLANDQIPTEHYYIGQRFRVYVKGVEETPKGPRILVSRSSIDFIESLFKLEVPEIQSGTVVIKGLAREAGSRTKVAVVAIDENLDPVGSCVGQRGTRIQAILSELGDEKIDIILWDEDTKTYLINALSPARIDKVTIEKSKKIAKVKVAEDQLSLAIGRRGQNVRLAGKLVGYEIDIDRDGMAPNPGAEPVADKPTEAKSESIAKKARSKKSKNDQPNIKAPKKTAENGKGK